MVIDEISLIDGDRELKKLKLLSGICLFILALSQSAGSDDVPKQLQNCFHLSIKQLVRFFRIKFPCFYFQQQFLLEELLGNIVDRLSVIIFPFRSAAFVKKIILNFRKTLNWNKIFSSQLNLVTIHI